jgi:hypothetical protein
MRPGRWHLVATAGMIVSSPCCVYDNMYIVYNYCMNNNICTIFELSSSYLSATCALYFLTYSKIIAISD